MYEAAGATLDFAVSLRRASKATVTVDYATSDATGPNAATANEDYYEPTSGTLTFAPGETAKTVSVAVLDDGRVETCRARPAATPTGGEAQLNRIRRRRSPTCATPGRSPQLD